MTRIPWEDKNRGAGVDRQREDAEGRSRGGGPVGQVKTPKAGFGRREEQEGDARECIAFIAFSS